MAEKLPFFPFDVARWLASEARSQMDLQERGLYFELMALQWREGSIPSERAHLIRACGTTEAEFDLAAPKVIPHFSLLSRDSTRRTHPVIEQIRARVLAAREKQAAAGRKRWCSNPSPESQANSLPNSLPMRLPRASRVRDRDSKNRKLSKPLEELCKTDIFDRYPGLKADQDFQLLISVVETPEKLAELRTGLDRLLASEQCRKGMAWSLRRWLTESLWTTVFPASREMTERERIRDL